MMSDAMVIESMSMSDDMISRYLVVWAALPSILMQLRGTKAVECVSDEDMIDLIHKEIDALKVITPNKKDIAALCDYWEKETYAKRALGRVKEGVDALDQYEKWDEVRESMQ